MDRYAVLGQPIAHSLSPQIHGWFAEQSHAQLSYEKVDVAPEALAERLAALHAQGYAGLNVTLPHKLAALAAATEKTPRAEIAGAANTLTRIGAGWRADNTDGEGLVRDLRDNLKWPIAGRRVLLLGAGGAARGVLKPVLDEKPAELVISSRTPWTVEKLAVEFKPHGPVVPRTHITLKGDRYDMVINATSAGLGGAAPRLPPDLLGPDAACYDLNWGAAFVPFREWAKAQGATRIADGLGMLVEQAAASFSLWRGTRPQTTLVIDRLRATGTTS
jgi:shikimate dehydrogenase